MKKIIVLMFLMVGVLNAQDEKVPKDLQALKDSTNKEMKAAIKAATDPLLKKYQKSLEALQKKYFAAKDANGIALVAKELEDVANKLAPDDDYQAKLIGKFKNKVYTIEVFPGNKAHLNTGFDAEVVISKKKTIRFNWNNGTAWEFKISGPDGWVTPDGKDVWTRVEEIPELNFK